MAADLRLIYSAATADLAADALDAFEEKWGEKFPSIAPAWRRAWQEVIPFFAFDPAIRKIIYTTNAIESLNRVIRKSIKTRGSFPTDEAATKLIYLAIRKFEKDGRKVSSQDEDWPDKHRLQHAPPGSGPTPIFCLKALLRPDSCQNR